MKWSNRTKMILLAAMILANVMVVVGWWLVKENGGTSRSLPLSAASLMGIMDVVFLRFVFLYPQLRKTETVGK